MTWQLASTLVILAAPIAIGTYDMIVWQVSGSKNTISSISIDTARDYPGYLISVCFLFGLLCAHLFTPGQRAMVLPAWLSLVLFVALPLLIVFGTLLLGLKRDVPMTEGIGDATRSNPLVSVLISLVLGAVVGGAFLPQAVRGDAP